MYNLLPTYDGNLTMLLNLKIGWNKTSALTISSLDCLFLSDEKCTDPELFSLMHYFQ